MDNQDKIDAILRKIAERKHTGADLSQLRELLSASDTESWRLRGKNIVGKIDGREIQIGDRYEGLDAQEIREIVRSIVEELRAAAPSPTSGVKARFVTQRKIGLRLLGTAVIAVIILVFKTPSDDIVLNIIILLISLSVGSAAALFLGTLGLEEEIPLGKNQIRAIGSFVTASVVFFLCLFVFTQIKEPSVRRGPILLKYITGINQYPTLALAEKTIPDELNKALKIDGTSVIDTDNPVYESIIRFINETGNKNLIRNQKTSNYSRTYVVNQSGRTTRGQTSEPIEESVFSQKKNDFYNDTVNYEGEIEDFHYAPLFAPFQTQADNAQWTSIITDSLAYEPKLGLILQYPKLSDIKRAALKDVSSYINNSDLSDEWLKNVIDANQDSRGFIAYTYSFVKNLFDKELFGGCGTYTVGITRISPTLYVRFAYIQNISKKEINLESITYKIIGENNNPYQLTQVDKRDVLFQAAPTKTKPFYRGFTLQPNEYMFIPIEFGFDNTSVKKAFQKQLENTLDLSVLTGKVIYVAKPVEPEVIKQFKNSGDIAKDNQIFGEQIVFNKNFIENTKNPENLMEAIPNRFAVGAFTQIISVKIDGKNISAELPPNKQTGLAISTNYQSGSCPYLLVYNSQKRYWIDLGTVLYARRGKSLQHEEIHSLGDNISKFSIEEREPEITYIDYLSILYTDPRTKTQQEVSYPNPQLAKIDGDYFLLHQGESIEIELANLIPAKASDVKLKINGYYEVLLDDIARPSKANTM